MKSHQYLFHIFVVCFIGLLPVEYSQSENTHPLHITPFNETLCPPNKTCQTLDSVAHNPILFFTNNRTIYFLHGIHYLETTDFILVESVNNLSLVGISTSTPNGSHSASKVQCSGQGGFRFLGVQNLLIQSLSFSNCGAYLFTSYFQNLSVIATLVFQSVTNLKISGAAVYNSTGVGVYAENTLGNSMILDSSLFLNGASTESLGGNLVLSWSAKCNVGIEPPITFNIENSTFAYGGVLHSRKGVSRGIQTNLSSCGMVKLFIRHCVLLANSGGAGGNLGITILDQKSWYQQRVEITIDSTSIQHGLAENGGGIALVINTVDGTSVNHVALHKKYKAVISNSTFISNRAYYRGGVGGGGGGGIFVAADFSIFRLHVSNTTFLHNSALGSIGGGISVVIKCSYFYSFEPELAALLISDSTFHNNTATQGGGLNINSEKSYFLTCVKSCFITLIQNTAFTENAATYTSSAMRFSISSAHHLAMKRVDFLRNQINAMVSPHSVEETDLLGTQATVSIVNSPKVTITNCSYLENLGTALLAVDSNILFSGDNGFKNNTGNRGGGMAMSSSYMLLSRHSHLWFQNNQALFGGAIYIQEQELFSQVGDDLCLFLLAYPSNGTISEPSVKHLYFEGNTAHYAGDVLYGGRIDTCTMLSNDNNQLTGASFDTLSSFASQVGDSVIASTPTVLCLCINNEPNCENRSMSIEVVSGESFTLSLVATGQRFGIAPSEVHSAILSEDQTHTHFLKQSIHQLEFRCTNVTFTLYSVSAVEAIALSVEKNVGTKIDSSKSLLIEATRSPCPMGFVLSGEPPRCICSPALLEHQLKCDVLNWTIQRKVRTWISSFEGNVSGILVHDHCPFDYCKIAETWLNISAADQQCVFNRTGILCGKCKEGLSLVLGSSRCLQCSNNYISLLLVFALAGILLVLTIKSCNLTVSLGGVSSLIFYANIIQINQTLFFLPGDVNMLTVFIAWLNLDFGIVTCFFNGMDAVTKTAMQFIFPLYLCSIALTVTIVSHRSGRLTRLFGKHVIPVIATLILTADAKLLRSAIIILSITTLKYPDSSTRILWLYDGNIDYWDNRHIVLILIAFLIITVHFILLCLLLFNQCLQRSSEHKYLSWIWRFEPYFDAYTATIKDKYRFWTGLLVLFRSILFIFSVFSPAFSLSSIVLGACCLLILGLCFGGVHKHNVLNILEPFVLLNLILIAAFTMYAQNSGNQEIRIAMVYISVSIMFIVFLTITIYEIYRLNPWIKKKIMFWCCRRRHEHVQCRLNAYQSTVSLTTDYQEFDSVSLSSNLLQPLILKFNSDEEAILVTEEENCQPNTRPMMNTEGALTLTVDDHDSQSSLLTNSDDSTLIENQKIQATSSTQKITEETLVEFTDEKLRQPTIHKDSSESGIDSSVGLSKHSDSEEDEINQDKRLAQMEAETTQCKERFKQLYPSLVTSDEYGLFLHMHEPSTPILYKPDHDNTEILSTDHEPGCTGALKIQHSILQQSSATASTDSALTHTSSEGTEQLPPAVPYLDPIEMVTFDHSGGEYANKAHSIIIKVPQGAIPKGVKVGIEVGVTLYGPFSFPWKTKPVSPIVWLCTQQDVHLRKAIEVVLPHCIHGLEEGEYDDLGMRFLKANHHEDTIASEEHSVYHFHPLEGKLKFTPSCGTVHIHHFCFLCISANKTREVVQRSGYCLSRVIPHPWPASQSQIFIYFCVTYFMKTCLTTIERQYSTGFRIQTREFYFTSAGDKQLFISIERDIPKGWFAILEDSEVIGACEVDFWERDAEQLELMEERRMYPPRFTVCVTGSSATGPSSLQVKFAGSQQKLNTEIMLPYVQREGLNDSRPTDNLWQNEDVGVGLHNAPSDRDLMNYVVAKIPTKWKEVGVQLRVAHECLERTEAENGRNQQYCFLDILNKWKRNASPPYTWATLIDALLQPSVDEKLLAQTLIKIFS